VCEKAGTIGHTLCGVCVEHGCPRARCGCFLGPYLVNYRMPVIEVEHAGLVRASEESDFSSRCPVCGFGLLLVQRDWGTYKIVREDRCTRCAQSFKYTDAVIGGEVVP